MFELFSLPNLLCNIQQDSIESLIAPLRTKKRTNHPDTLRVTDRVTNSNPFLTAWISNCYLESRRKWVMGGSDCGESCRCNVEHSLCALNIFESNHSRRHSSLPHSSLECLGHVWLLSCLSKLNANGCGKRAACSCIKLHTDTGYLLSPSRPNLCLLVYDSLPWRFGAKYSRCIGFFCSFGSSGGSSLSQDSLFTCNHSDADHITLDCCTAPLAFTWHAVTQLVCRPGLLSPEDMFRCFSRCGC